MRINESLRFRLTPMGLWGLYLYQFRFTVGLPPMSNRRMRNLTTSWCHTLWANSGPFSQYKKQLIFYMDRYNYFKLLIRMNILELGVEKGWGVRLHCCLQHSAFKRGPALVRCVDGFEIAEVTLAIQKHGDAVGLRQSGHVRKRQHCSSNNENLLNEVMRR